MDKTCFAYCEEIVCTALEVNTCPGEQCPFFKTPEQFKKSRRSVYKRLANLRKIMQEGIASTYYGGQKPWQKGGAVNDR
jgi:hypothetical protein